ncbi:MAG: hypothetical protein J5944_11305 [Lentisphaeria bacterium]|nr:hypothetical protein [Lentisphaeria bacterium]
MKQLCGILFPLCLMLTLCAGENSGTAEFRIIEGFGYRNIDREIARKMDEKFDPAGLAEKYAELLKERRNLEKQLAEAGLPFDRESAIRFRMNGVKTDPRLYGEAAKRIKSMEGKMFPGLPPGLYSDAEAQRMQRTKFLESIQEDWAWIESHPVFPINMPWDPEKRLAEQSIQDLKLNTTLAQIWQMRIRAKATESGNVSGALEDFGRSRVVMELDGPIIAGLIAVSCELMRLNTLSELLSRVKLTPEQLKKLDEELQEDEVLLRRVWLHAWIQEGVCGLDIIESFIQGTAYEGLAKYRTEEGRMPLRFVVPWTREWIFLAKRNLRIAAEVTQMKDFRSFVPKEFPKDFLISRSLLNLEFDGTNEYLFMSIAQIRAARTALRYLGLKSMEIPKDPFTGEPFRIRKGEFFRIRKGEFFEFEAGRTVRGIRFYSAGMDGKYTDGEYLKWGGGPKKTDDTGFDLVEPEVPASGTFIP